MRERVSCGVRPPRTIESRFSLTCMLITHSAFPTLILTPWIMGRKEPLELYGPAGTRGMVAHILQAYDADIKTRTEDLEHSNLAGYNVNVHEITPGVVYEDPSVTVKAFNAYHGSPQIGGGGIARHLIQEGRELGKVNLLLCYYHRSEQRVKSRI